LESPISNINKAFESRARLGIMSLLTVESKMDFNALKEALGLTDGNLASHMRALEDLGYVAVEKKFVSRKPKTNYRITGLGQEAFTLHLNALEQIILNSKTST
jgi:DNA-binding HxlR family transcriptional regulator